MWSNTTTGLQIYTDGLNKKVTRTMKTDSFGPSSSPYIAPIITPIIACILAPVGNGDGNGANNYLLLGFAFAISFLLMLQLLLWIRDKIFSYKIRWAIFILPNWYTFIVFILFSNIFRYLSLLKYLSLLYRWFSPFSNYFFLPVHNHNFFLEYCDGAYILYLRRSVIILLI